MLYTRSLFTTLIQVICSIPNQLQIPIQPKIFKRTELTEFIFAPIIDNNLLEWGSTDKDTRMSPENIRKHWKMFLVEVEIKLNCKTAAEFLAFIGHERIYLNNVYKIFKQDSLDTTSSNEQEEDSSEDFQILLEPSTINQHIPKNEDIEIFKFIENLIEESKFIEKVIIEDENPLFLKEDPIDYEDIW